MTLLSGLISALVSALAYGTFAVPVKNKKVMEAQVHPLIFQSYKSLMCFLTSWLVLLYSPFGFTWWASLAACMWVTDGILAIISIQLAGLGLCQTTWSVVSLFVSFAWGKLFFKEPIQNVALSVTGLSLMSIGMIGLGYIAAFYRAPEESMPLNLKSASTAADPEDQELNPLAANQASEETQSLTSGPKSHEQQDEATLKAAGNGLPSEGQQDGLAQAPGTASSNLSSGIGTLRGHKSWKERYRTAIGLLGSLIVGIFAGTMMICLKMAPPECKGDQYTVSFGIGVGLVTSAALCTYFGACTLLGRQPPSFHVKIAAGPACLAGILWSIGNYFSILAVASLGMAVGWPLVQCSLIVANCWALFWYKEVVGLKAVVAFLASSCIILIGVFMLAYYGL